jgi:hypothetical protein
MNIYGERKMKNKICFIIPYFGKLPKGFQYYLETVKNNSDVNFLLFTDDKSSFIFPSNLKVIYLSFFEMKSYIQRKFNFPISLERPYKLCDYKVAYGDIFSEYLEGYDFWGHCDIDLLWGDFKKFYPDELLNQYDHLGIWGHCQLFRNNERINNIYRIVDKKIGCDYKEVFSSNKSFGFDELPLNRLFKKYTTSNYYSLNFANLNKYDYSFHLVNYCPEDDYKNAHQIFEYKDGKLLRHYIFNNKIFTEEFCYLHLWCRPISYSINRKFPLNHFYVFPEKVTNKPLDINIKTIKRLSRKNPFRYYFKSIWFNRKKLTPSRIVFNIKGMIKYKKKKSNEE